MTPISLGEFEQLVLLAVLRLGPNAYGVPIRREIEECTGRPVARGAVYMTLERLHAKGYLRSWHSEPTAERGGRSRRHYEVTRSAVAALGDSRKALLRMWRGLEPKLTRS
jgi:PadR family transcriptional regulator, regulatory protein PadR